ncbi:cytochrome b [Hydrogenovibrio kuenenii]|uniref:cytochrome b n=1 Tax=Hydrogenovibrio kuenenii TaxID=63658 RepID=UPI000463E348|nr:cytochrome b [Hydrogenovibrio kuenenii]
MSLKNTEHSFGLVSRANHWISAFAFILAILTAFIAEEFMAKGEARSNVFQLHFSLGISLFLLMILGMIWLKISPNPADIGENRLEIVLSHIVKGFLYLSLIVMPISGYMMVSAGGHDIGFFNLFTLPNLVGENPDIKAIVKPLHVYSGFFITFILMVHIAGALKHHLVYKDNVLNRMLGRTPSQPE